MKTQSEQDIRRAITTLEAAVPLVREKEGVCEAAKLEYVVCALHWMLDLEDAEAKTFDEILLFAKYAHYSGDAR